MRRRPRPSPPPFLKDLLGSGQELPDPVCHNPSAHNTEDAREEPSRPKPRLVVLQDAVAGGRVVDPVIQVLDLIVRLGTETSEAKHGKGLGRMARIVAALRAFVANFVVLNLSLRSSLPLTFCRRSGTTR